MQRLGPRGQRGQDLGAADHDLDEVQRGRPTATARTSDRMVALGAPGDDRDRDHDEADEAATQRCRTWAEVDRR